MRNLDINNLNTTEYDAGNNRYYLEFLVDGESVSIYVDANNYPEASHDEWFWDAKANVDRAISEAKATGQIQQGGEKMETIKEVREQLAGHDLYVVESEYISKGEFYESLTTFDHDEALKEAHAIKDKDDEKNGRRIVLTTYKYDDITDNAIARWIESGSEHVEDIYIDYCEANEEYI